MRMYHGSPELFDRFDCRFGFGFRRWTGLPAATVAIRRRMAPRPSALYAEYKLNTDKVTVFTRALAAAARRPGNTLALLRCA